MIKMLRMIMITILGGGRGGRTFRGAPKGGAPKGGAPNGGGPKISRFFSFSHHIFLSFFTLLGCWWCLRRGLQKHHQNSTIKPPERGKKSESGGGRGKKKSAKFWASHPRGPIFLGFGPHPLGSTMTNTHTTDPNGLAKIGQIRMAKTGLAKVGPFRSRREGGG